MLRPARAFSPKPSRANRRTRRRVRLAATTSVALAFAASTALAAHLALTLGSAANARLGERVVISAQGRTLYTLTPETSRHLLCRTSECLRFWPPLTVGSSRTKLSDGPGVQGHLGIVRRSNGTIQVTLRGLPLYRYSQDHAKGDTNGEGIESFGGRWHAVTASPSETAGKPAMPSAPAAQPTPPSYPESPPMTASPPSMTPSTPATTPATTPVPPASPPPYQYPTY